MDADFAGGWKDGDHDSPESVLSRTGFVIMYAGCPITWGSKLQTEIALSTAESEYIALSTAMREVIPFLGLMQEIGGIFVCLLGSLYSSVQFGKTMIVVLQLPILPSSHLGQNKLLLSIVTLEVLYPVE